MSTAWMYPSLQFPHPSGVSLIAGDDWHPLQAPGAVLALGREVSSASFRANVVVNVAINQADFSIDDAVAGFLLATNDYLDKVNVAETRYEVSGFPAFGQEMTYREPNIGTLLVSTRLVTVPGSNFVNLVAVTASAGADRMEPDYAEIQNMLTTLTVMPAV